MQISGAGFNPYSSVTRIKPYVPQEISNAQNVQQQRAFSAIDPDGDGDVDSGVGKDFDSDRGRNIDIRA